MDSKVLKLLGTLFGFLIIGIIVGIIIINRHPEAMSNLSAIEHDIAYFTAILSGIIIFCTGIIVAVINWNNEF